MHVHTTHTHPMGVKLSLAKGTSITLGLRSANASADPIPDAVIISTLKKKQCTLKKIISNPPHRNKTVTCKLDIHDSWIQVSKLSFTSHSSLRHHFKAEIQSSRCLNEQI